MNNKDLYTPDRLKEILRLAAQGDEQAFSLFFRFYQQKVMQIAFYFTRSEAHSKDITQDVFVKIWNSREQLTGIQYLDAWIAIITRNFTITALNKIAREELLGERYINYLPGVQLPDNTALDYQDVEHYVRQALEKLPEQQRIIFKMAKLEGFSREEIGKKLGISPNTVKVHLLRSVRFVRGYLLEKLDYLTFFALVISFS